MKVAITGCGSIADLHGACIEQLSEHQLVACNDMKQERAERFAARFGGTTYVDLDEMLELEKPDVLHICTPHYLHVPMAVKALKKGIHVYLEKPAAISSEQYEQLYKAVQETDCFLGISYQNRYNLCVQKAKDILLMDKVGELLGGRAFLTWGRNREYYTGSEWRGLLEKEGGGCLINQAIHTLDLLGYLIGRPVSVDASMKTHHLKECIEVEDTVEAYVTYQKKNGTYCNGSFFATTAFCQDSVPLIEVVCEHVTIRIEDPWLELRWNYGEIERINYGQKSNDNGKAAWGSGHWKSIADFYQSIAQKKRYSLDLMHTDESNRLMFAVYQSAREQRLIVL